MIFSEVTSDMYELVYLHQNFLPLISDLHPVMSLVTSALRLQDPSNGYVIFCIQKCKNDIAAVYIQLDSPLSDDEY